MTFISYAQNFEDVMLWRALKHIEKGFYIDIGAWSPDIESVTRAFYERGWQGINIEPNQEFHSSLLMRRARDINLCIALSDEAGRLTMNFFRNSGLSTLDEMIAQEHVSKGWIIDKAYVEVTTLATLWKQYVPEGQDVHFLKVDVEGSEEAVLNGNDWSKYRPWIVVVEATIPTTQQESHEAWEPMIIASGYCFAYADGLNRFYVANEQAKLLPFFRYPPNIYDHFKLNSQQRAEVEAQQAKAEMQQAKAETEQARVEVHHSLTAKAALDRELQAVYASRSWRFTYPLRVAFDVKPSFSGISLTVRSGIGSLLRRVLFRMIRFVLDHPRLSAWVLEFLSKFPSLKEWLYRFAAKGMIASSLKLQASLEPSTSLSTLTPYAHRVYINLIAAIEQHKKEIN